MPVLHLRVVAHVDGHPLFVAARRVSLTEYAIIDRNVIQPTAEDGDLFSVTPVAMLLTVDGSATVGFAGDTATNSVILEEGGCAGLTNAVSYVVQASPAGTRVQGLG